MSCEGKLKVTGEAQGNLKNAQDIALRAYKQGMENGDTTCSSRNCSGGGGKCSFDLIPGSEIKADCTLVERDGHNVIVKYTVIIEGGCSCT